MRAAEIAEWMTAEIAEWMRLLLKRADLKLGGGGQMAQICCAVPMFYSRFRSRGMIRDVLLFYRMFF